MVFLARAHTLWLSTKRLKKVQFRLKSEVERVNFINRFRIANAWRGRECYTAFNVDQGNLCNKLSLEGKTRIWRRMLTKKKRKNIHTYLFYAKHYQTNYNITNETTKKHKHMTYTWHMYAQNYHSMPQNKRIRNDSDDATISGKISRRCSGVISKKALPLPVVNYRKKHSNSGTIRLFRYVGNIECTELRSKQ